MIDWPADLGAHVTWILLTDDRDRFRAVCVDYAGVRSRACWLGPDRVIVADAVDDALEHDPIEPIVRVL